MHLEPTQENGRQLLLRGIEGPVTMLNLLRFRPEADYSASPELAPARPITGREAYDLYVAHTEPLLADAGGRVVFVGEGGQPLIGPIEERWDRVMLVEHHSVAAFMAMADNHLVTAGLGHRAAALEDSRLIPIEQN